jgi:uncharacterized protein (TIGR02996 family)
MTDADDFLAAIIDRPDDDLPRLVFADFLEESGDGERAEFIRVQCELARLPAGHPDRPALAARGEELLKANRPRWVVPVSRMAQQFRRGFVEVVRTTADLLLVAAARLFRATPVRELRLQTADQHTAALARLPGLDRVEALDLSNHGFGTWPLLAPLLERAPLPSMRRLTLRNNQIWPEAVRALAGTPVTGRLEALNLSGNPLSDVGLEHLATGPAFAGLTELIARGDEQDFSDCVHAAGASALARSATLTKLRRLDLRGQYIGDAGLIDLVRSPNTAGLAEFDLADNEIGSLGSQAVEALVESPHLRSMEWVSLARNRIDRLAAEALASWPRLRDGVRVDLRKCEIDRAGLDAILRGPFAAQFVLDPPE